MIKYREIIRLTALGFSQRTIAGSVGCAPSTVHDVQTLARARGLAWPLPEEMGDAAIRQVIYPAPDRADKAKAPIDHEWVERELGRRGVTLNLLWHEYAERASLEGGDPYLYSAFCRKHQEWARSNPEVVMHIEWEPGQWSQVDWAGDTMLVRDPDTLKPLKVRVFVSDLPYSARIYAEGFYRMDEASWIEAHVHMFSYFGGTTPLIAPDNLKTGIIANTMDRLVVNEQYRRMCEYYGVAVVPARVRRPRDKGSVEGAVRIVEREAMAALRDRTFFSLSELNQALLDRVDAINARPFEKREGSRDEAFFSQEKPRLQPLPPRPYELKERKLATVQFNYHVAFDGRYYSVPFTYVRRQVEVCATRSMVTISLDGERIARHQRSYAPKGAYVTDVSHMPRAHKDYAEWSGDRFRAWAREKGEFTFKVADAILRSRQVEQQSFRSCRALLSLGERYGWDVLEEAAEKACQISRNPSYKTTKALVKQLVEARREDPDAHAFLRGAESYGDID